MNTKPISTNEILLYLKIGITRVHVWQEWDGIERAQNLLEYAVNII
jgi:hypothetical protein